MNGRESLNVVHYQNARKAYVQLLKEGGAETKDEYEIENQLLIGDIQQNELQGDIQQNELNAPGKVMPAGAF